MENTINNQKAKMSLLLKALLIFGFVVVLLIPTVFISFIITERESRRAEAIIEVSSKWAGIQTITGPILTVPYHVYYIDENKVSRVKVEYATFLPENLNIISTVQPEKRYRGIYEVVVYNSEIELTGNYNVSEISIPDVSPDLIQYDKAFISIGINDLRGLQKQVNLQWNKKDYLFNPGAGPSPMLYSGISIPVALTIDTANAEYQTNINFKTSLTLKGSEKLNFVPVGKQTKVKMTSPWANPSFDGAFLPDKRDVNEQGFNSEWTVLNLNRNYPQSWTGAEYNIDESSFGVSLIVPADNYQKSSRSVKYAFLIIALTFILFFFIESINKIPVSLLSYALIGIALCIFYTLLISISEHITFIPAYIISTVMTVGLITVYIQSIVRNMRISLLIFGILILLYSFIFTIIQLEDMALLMGSIGLFIILAILMYFSRKLKQDV